MAAERGAVNGGNPRGTGGVQGGAGNGGGGFNMNPLLANVWAGRTQGGGGNPGQGLFQGLIMGGTNGTGVNVPVTGTPPGDGLFQQGDQFRTRRILRRGNSEPPPGDDGRRRVQVDRMRFNGGQQTPPPPLQGFQMRNWLQQPGTPIY